MTTNNTAGQGLRGRPRLPVRLVRGGWPYRLEAALARLVEDDPRVVLDADVSDAAFSRAMACMQVGETIKITGPRRHEAPDGLLLEHVDLRGATVLDVGASDGSTSVELVARLPDVAAYVIADLYLYLHAVPVAGHVVFFDEAGECVLVAGRRLLTWPGSSPVVTTLTRPLLALARRRRAAWRSVLLLCPSARSLIGSDPRVTSAVHDVFTAWSGPPRPDVIKVANVLRRLYFTDEAISRALGALFRSLPEGGHLLVVNNPRARGVGSRGGLYRRDGDRFAVVARTPEPPEIDDLVLALRQVANGAVPEPRPAPNGASADQSS